MFNSCEPLPVSVGRRTFSGLLRELERYQAQVARLNAMQAAQSAVLTYENHIRSLVSLHTEQLHSWNWSGIASSRPALEPVQEERRGQAAQAELNRYRPGFLDRALHRSEEKRRDLEGQLDEARRLDQEGYAEAVRKHAEGRQLWEARVALARRLINHEPTAYLDALKELGRFDQLPAGRRINIAVDDQANVAVTVLLHGEDIVPFKELRALKRGGLSQKDMPRIRFYSIYQDYVCSAVLRVAREIFGLLPVEAVLTHAVVERVNQRTGHLEEQTILSCFVLRETLDRLNLGSVDPSEALRNFVHRMDFKGTGGFAAIAPFEENELRTRQHAMVGEDL